MEGLKIVTEVVTTENTELVAEYADILEALLDAVVDAAFSMIGYLPAKAIALLDGAAARAVLAGKVS